MGIASTIGSLGMALGATLARGAGREEAAETIESIGQQAGLLPQAATGGVVGRVLGRRATTPFQQALARTQLTGGLRVPVGLQSAVARAAQAAPAPRAPGGGLGGLLPLLLLLLVK